jgi:hypothetical protein
MGADYQEYWVYNQNRDTPLTCAACGWTGYGSDHEHVHGNLLDVSCPECGTTILIVPFPTLEQTQVAADAGNTGAQEELPRMEARQIEHQSFLRRATPQELRDATELPDLDGDRLVIDWDFEETGEERWTVLRHGIHELWREVAYFEGYGRFEDVFNILRTRYGSRLAEVRPTPGSELYLYGDKPSSQQVIADLNASLAAAPGA